MGQDRRIEIDLFAEAESKEDFDVVVEVKDWARPVSATQVDEFIANKKQIDPHLKRPAVFVMFSEHGFTSGQIEGLAKHKILACDGKTLTKLAEE